MITNLYDNEYPMGLILATSADLFMDTINILNIMPIMVMGKTRYHNIDQGTFESHLIMFMGKINAQQTH